jgi:RimJ/RimL family protein N-acetyltransferase
MSLDPDRAPTLRPAAAGDLERLCALARHPEVAPALSTTAADDLADALAAGELWVIEHEGAVVGGVRCRLVNRRSRIVEIATLMLDPAVRGRGLARAAVRELCARLVREQGVHRIEAETYGFNRSAQRVFERAGFTREGVRRRAYDRAGGWQDGVRYGLLAEELGDDRP